MPAVTVSSISATPSVSGPLAAGRSVAFTLTTSQSVTVTGSPLLTLNDGATATYNAAASTGTSLVFGYTVAAGQNTADLQVTGLALNGATIGAPASVSFAAAATYAAGAGPFSVTAADLNRDGKADLAVVDRGGAGNTVSVLLGNGSGGFGTATTYAVGGQSSLGTVADVNGDSRPDIIVASNLPNTVSVLQGSVSGGFVPAIAFAAGSLPVSVSVADVNGDGRADIVAANFFTDSLSVLLGNATSGFGSATTYATQGGAFSVALADVNGDSKLDIIAPTDAGAVSVLLGNGSGGFAAAVNYAAPSGLRGVSVADVNGDGRLDVVAGNAALNSNFVSVLLGNASGGFGPVVTYATGGTPFSVAFADLNGDGKQDIVASTNAAGSGPISVLLGDGSGGFGPATTYAAGSGAASVTVADFNGDGRPDIVAADFNANAVSVLLNAGSTASGTFDASSIAAAPGHDTLLVVDTTPPAAPSTPDLTAASDSGASATDNLTNVAAPTFTGTAEAGATVTLLDTNGTTVLGTGDATGGIWSIASSALDGGNHTITAKATDAAGNTGAASPGLAVTIDLVAPTVLSDTASPATGIFTIGRAISFTLALSEPVVVTGTPSLVLNDGGTAAYVSGSGTGSLVFGTTVAAGQESAALTVLGVTLPPGASIQDAAGNAANLAGANTTFVGLAVDTTAPAVAATLANDTGASAADRVTSSPTLTGTAESGGVVTVQNGATVLGTATVGRPTATASAAGSWAFTPTLADGTYTLTALETDAAGNVGTATLSFTLDTAAPSVALALASGTAPGGTTGSAALTGMGEAGGTVTVSNGATVLGTAAVAANGSWGFVPVLADGSYTLTASETDLAGNTGTASLGFTLNAAGLPPVVTVGLASDTGVSATDTVTSAAGLAGIATPGGVVTISNGATVLGTATVAANGSWSFTPTLANGTYSLTASQTGTGGTGSATLGFTLDTVAPAVAVALASGTAPGGTTGSAALTGTGEAGGTVTVSNGATVLGTAAVAGNGSWSFTPTLANGAYTLTASETDLAGNTGTASLGFTLSAVITPFSTLAVSSTDQAAVVTVSAALTPAITGTYGNLGGGTVSADGLTYTVSGTAVQVNAALAGVMLTPAAGQAVPAGVVASLAGSPAGTTLGNAGAGSAVLMGSTTGASTLVGGAGSGVFFAQGGPTRIEVGTGPATVSAPTGPVTVVSGTGGSVIGLGTGTALVNGQGRDTIIAGTGAATIGAAANSLVSLDGGPALVSAGSGSTVVGGAGADTVGVRGTGAVFFAGPGRSTFIGGTGSSTVAAGSGSETIFGGAGGGVFSGGSAGGNLIVAGQGATTIFGGGDGDVLFAAGSAGDVIVAGAGNETLQGVGSSGNDLFFAGPGNTLIGLGSGQDTVFAGTGSSTVVAGTGRDVFAFVNGRAGGTESIIGFKVGTDQISVQGYAPGEINRALASATSTPGTPTTAAATTLTLSDNTRISFLGLGSADARVFG